MFVDILYKNCIPIVPQDIEIQQYQGLLISASENNVFSE